MFGTVFKGDLKPSEVPAKTDTPAAKKKIQWGKNGETDTHMDGAKKAPPFKAKKADTTPSIEDRNSISHALGIC